MYIQSVYSIATKKKVDKSENPGFWLPVHQRNRVFSRICGL